jgi:hypothetical protein
MPTTRGYRPLAGAGGAQLYPPGSTYDVGGRQFYQGLPTSPITRTPTRPQAPTFTAPGYDPSAGFGATDTFTLDPNAPGGAGGAGGGSIGIRRAAPDYRGILDQYTSDWRARLNAGLASNEAQRLSRARQAINRLGVRDAGTLLPQLQQFGLTAADLQQAADNPWSDIKAIQQQADRARGQGQAEFAARGGFRSGGTSQLMEDVENQRARTEAQATQETLGGLSSDLFNAADWERQQRDELDQRSAGLETQLAQLYQPYEAQATWDPNAGGYRYQNTIYDQYGNVIRTV